jgi:hypothetical protein
VIVENNFSAVLSDFKRVVVESRFQQKNLNEVKAKVKFLVESPFMKESDIEWFCF